MSISSGHKKAALALRLWLSGCTIEFELVGPGSGEMMDSLSSDSKRSVCPSFQSALVSELILPLGDFTNPPEEFGEDTRTFLIV